jgi:galactonate dehydratase
MKIASMAEAYDVALAPHCPLGPIALASCLAVDFVSYNAVLQECSLGIHYNTGAELLDYVHNKEDFAVVDGYMKPLSKPGLGVEVNIEAIEAAAAEGCDWKNPIWHHEDGTIAEW